MFNIGKRMKNEQRYKIKDKIEPTYELIYRAPFEYLTALCKHFPTFSLVTVSSLLACKFALGIELIDITSQISIGPTMSDGNELIGFAVAFYIVNLGLVYSVRNYPLRIYKAKNDYLAIFEGILPFSTRQYRFQKEDMCACATNSMMPWRECMYKMKDRTVLVFSHHFKKPADFHEMLKK